MESFNGRLRDELLAIEEFATLLEAQVVVEAWRLEYNTQRPHSRLGWHSPAAYPARWREQQPAGPSLQMDSFPGAGQMASVAMR